MVVKERIGKVKINIGKVILWILFLPVMASIALWRRNKLVIAAVALMVISILLSVVSMAKPIVDEELLKQEGQLNRAKIAIENKDYVTAQNELNILLSRKLKSKYKEEAAALSDSVNAEADKIKEQEKEDEAKTEAEKQAFDAKSASNVVTYEQQKYLDDRSAKLLTYTGISTSEANDILKDLKSVGINYIDKCTDADSTGIEGVKVYKIKFENKTGLLTIKNNKTLYINFDGILFDETKGGVIKNIND